MSKKLYMNYTYLTLFLTLFLHTIKLIEKAIGNTLILLFTVYATIIWIFSYTKKNISYNSLSAQ